MNRVRWLILILGPLPIVGSSWAVSGWMKSQPREMLGRNELVPSMTEPYASGGASESDRSDGVRDPLASACRESASRWSKQLGSGHSVIERPPFVLAGDLSGDELNRWHSDVIDPAVRALHARYFHVLPRQPVSVLLFYDEQGYDAASRRLFGESGVSIYGYYKPNQRTILLNAATGQGTLLHELTHALVDFDFPEAPDWFNEGLASLHEQCRFRADEHGPWIEGLPNWRLRGLQKVIGEGRLRSLESLAADPDFRGPLEGTNYAQARYFCMYMQQRGVLERFYETLRADHARDPRGLAAISRMFPTLTWRQLDEDFAHWVRELTE